MPTDKGNINRIYIHIFQFQISIKIPFTDKFKIGFEILEGHHSWATAPFILALLGWLPLIFGGNEFNQSNIPRSVKRKRD